MSDLAVVWGARAIGKVINRSPRETYYLLEQGSIHAARKVGERWTADIPGLRQQFSPSSQSSNTQSGCAA